MISTYSQICPVVFGPGATRQVGEKVKEFEAKKVFCICDMGVKRAGIADKVCRVLEECGIDTVIFDGVQADPKDTIVEEAAGMALEAGADTIVGIGGGSSLDAAKAVAVLMKNPGKISDYYMGGKTFTETAPLILLPTASGTGSEVTPMAVITDSVNEVKQTVLNHASVAIVDPELTLSVPPHVTASTGFDALSHAVEAYTSNSKFANPLSDVLALKAIKLISDNLETAYFHGSDIDARVNMSLASNFAGMAFSESCVHFGHAAAQELGGQFHLPHGAVCALTLPEVIEFSAEVMPERVMDVAIAMGIDIPEDAHDAVGHITAEEVRERMHKLHIRSLKEYGLTREQAVACAEGAVANNWFIIASPKKVGVAEMAVLIGKVYDNY